MPGTGTSTVLVVDDDAAVCWALERALVRAGWQTVVAADAAAARRRLKADIDVVLTDVRMPGEDGLDLLAWIRSQRPALPVVVMTAHGTMETAVQAVGRGAFDYLPKPLDLERTLAVVRRALGEIPLAASARPAAAGDEGGIIGSSPVMQEVYRRLASAANSDVEVLLTGPAGSGKEALARALHRSSPRQAGPFIQVGCGAIGESAAAELAARHAAASGGILFLDEVDGLPAAAQSELARLIAGARPTGTGTRVVAATRRDLGKLAAAGAFNDDLAWRLRAVHIAVPALIERLDDLPALVRHVLGRAAARLGRELAITDAALVRLRAHPWPGNIRELKHVIEEAAVIAGGGVVDAEHLPLVAAPGAAQPQGFAAAAAQLARRLLESHPGEVHLRAIDELEAALFAEALARTGGNQLRSAELLGINRATLKKRMDQLGIGR